METIVKPATFSVDALAADEVTSRRQPMTIVWPENTKREAQGLVTPGAGLTYTSPAPTIPPPGFIKSLRPLVLPVVARQVVPPMPPPENLVDRDAAGENRPSESRLSLAYSDYSGSTSRKLDIAEALCPQLLEAAASSVKSGRPLRPPEAKWGRT